MLGVRTPLIVGGWSLGVVAKLAVQTQNQVRSVPSLSLPATRTTPPIAAGIPPHLRRQNGGTSSVCAVADGTSCQHSAANHVGSTERSAKRSIKTSKPSHLHARSAPANTPLSAPINTLVAAGTMAPTARSRQGACPRRPPPSPRASITF